MRMKLHEAVFVAGLSIAMWTLSMDDGAIFSFHSTFKGKIKKVCQQRKIELTFKNNENNTKKKPDREHALSIIVHKFHITLTHPIDHNLWSQQIN